MGVGGTPMVIRRGDVTCGLSVRYRACAPVCVCVCVCACVRVSVSVGVHAPAYASMFVCAPISSDGVIHKQKCLYPRAAHKAKTVLKSSSEVAGSCVGLCLLPYVTVCRIGLCLPYVTVDEQTLHTTAHILTTHLLIYTISAVSI